MSIDSRRFDMGQRVLIVGIYYLILLDGETKGLLFGLEENQACRYD